MKNLIAIAALIFASVTIVSCDGDDPVIPVDPVDSVANEVIIASNITEDVRWSKDTVYVLGGRIAVESGATLTIDAGTIIKGQAGTGANSTALIIARGAKLMAMGTATEPIIFTSVADEIEPGQIASPNLDANIGGLWGGVIILGSAPGSFKNDAVEVNIEGIPTTDSNGLYGGSAPADNSGSINYISIRHGGTLIGEGNEINGLTLGSVGSGTVINGVEIVSNADDGIEWFGGTVDVSNVLVWNSNDDGLDTDQDWQGTCSDFIVVTPTGGSAFELDGPEGTAKVNGATGFHTFDNGVVYAGSDLDHIVDWDGTTNAALTNMHFFGLDAAYLDDFAVTKPIESFGGDASGASSNWEIELPSGLTATLADAFGADAAAITATVSTRTNGPAAADFAWTWASVSGALTTIGL